MKQRIRVLATIIAGCVVCSQPVFAAETETQAPKTDVVSEEYLTAASESEATSAELVETEKGWLMGTKTNGTYIFKGIRYATAERFQMPQEVEPWEGIRTAMVYGESSPTGSDTVSVSDYATPSGTDMVENENCQFLNVWTQSIDKDAKKPVIFWIHGGGWFSGASNELTYYDGANLSASEDIVFVSINHRLNSLGYTDLSAYGDEYKNSGNVGLADMVAALEWVQKNIEAFGGDPDNVTIVGQSGGGAKVTTLMGTPAAQGLFDKAMVLSGGVSGVTKEEAQAAGVALVEKTKEVYSLESDEEALETLKTISYNELKELASDTGVGEGPVIDGEYYPARTIDEDGNVSDLAKNIPVVITTAYSEIACSQFTPLTIAPAVEAISANIPVEAYLSVFSKAYMTEESMRQSIETKYGEATDAVLEIFRAAYPGHDDVDILSLDAGSFESLQMLDPFAAQSEAPVYRGVFAYEFPIFGGILAPHTGGDLPFLFNNLDKIPQMVAGDEETAQQLADTVSKALGNFARTGNPSQDGLEWPAYTTEEGAAMIFDAQSEVRYHHDAELIPIIEEEELPFDPQEQGGF